MTSVRKSVDDGFALAAERKREGVRAYEIAAELGIHPSEVSNYENGKRDRLPEGMGHSEYREALRRVVERRAAAVA